MGVSVACGGGGVWMCVVASDGGERCGRDMSEDVKKGRGVSVSVVLTYAPLPVVGSRKLG